MNRPTFKNFKKEAMADTAFKKEYEAMAPMWELRKKLIKLRIKEGKTQEQIAKLMGTQKSCTTLTLNQCMPGNHLYKKMSVVCDYPFE